MNSARPLIEEYFPLEEVSAEAVREKSAGRAYHISTLHWWWARRPLAAVRAALLATLVPASSFPRDPKETASLFRALAAWRGDTVGLNPVTLERARRLVVEAWPEGPPNVIDSFAGGGSVPLEATRLGTAAAAVELNPVAYMVGMGTLVWPQTYGEQLAEDVRRWGEWVRDQAWLRLSDLYPSPDGVDSAQREGQMELGSEPNAAEPPLAYLWTRTVPCPNPSCPSTTPVPLLRTSHVVRKENRRIAVDVVPDSASGTFQFRLRDDRGAEESAKRGKSSASACRMCGATISAKYLKQQGNTMTIGVQLVATVAAGIGRQGKRYLGVDESRNIVPSDDVLNVHLEHLSDAGLVPPDELIEPMGNAGLSSGKSYLYGIPTFTQVFTKRQLVTLLTLCSTVREARQRMDQEGVEPNYANAVAAYLGFLVNRVLDRSTSLARWNLKRETAESPFIRDRLAMMWDFVEVNPFSGISGDVTKALNAICQVIEHCASVGQPTDLRRGDARELPFEEASFDAAVIDPPYYDSVSYSNSSDFYYVWLKRSIGHLFPEHLGGSVAPKRNEMIAAAYRHAGDKGAADDEYEDMMTQALGELRRVLKPGAPMVVVYAHKTTSGWATLVGSLRSAGFEITEAWPIETEMQARRGGQDNASLKTSIFLVGRRRGVDSVGQWSSVSEELENTVADRVRSLADLGISGADLVIAAIGAGLGPYTRHYRVELDNGQPLEPSDFLDEVQTAVVKTILSDMMGISRSGVEAVDPVTQLYVMGRFQYGAAWVPFDELNTLVHGILAGSRSAGVELTGPRGLMSGASALVEQDGGNVRFRDFEERGSIDQLGLDGAGAPVLVDVLQRILWLAGHDPVRLSGYLLSVRPDPQKLRLVAQALSGSGLSRRGIGTSQREQDAIQRLLGSWKRLIDDNLFGAKT